MGRLPALERLELDGPAGRLEVRLELPDTELRFAGVMGHPHPLHGGTMQNNVVVHAARQLVALGGAIARFNFRGVGDSEGAHDHGRGEREDYLCVLDHLRERWSGLPLWVAGFSFGSIRAMECSSADGVVAYLGIAPPVMLERNTAVVPVAVPSALVLAGEDELVPPPSDAERKRLFPALRRVETVTGAGHLFDGLLEDLEEAVELCTRELLF